MSRDPRELAQRADADLLSDYGCEAVRAQLCDTPQEHSDNVKALQVLVREILRRMALAAEMPRWVPVEERFPTENERVLVSAIRANGERTRAFTYYYDGEFDIEDQSFAEKPKATHWLDNVPSPPREEA